MMKNQSEPAKFQQYVEEIRMRLVDIYSRDLPKAANRKDQDLETFELLNTTLEELSVTEEELRQQNEELLETRQELENEFIRYSDLFESAPDGFLVTDQEGVIQAANRAATTMFNLEPKFILQKPLHIFISEEDRPIFLKLLDNLHITGEVQNWKLTIWPQNNLPLRRILLSARLNPKPRGIGPDYLWLMRDITRLELKETEISELKHRLYEGIEAERMSIARDLHDGPIQDLYSISFILKGISPEQDVNSLQSDIININDTLQKVVNTLRSICGELRPPVLAPFGLSKAIRSNVDKLGETYPNLKIELNLQDDLQELPERVRLALYRIYQQLIMNSLLHAQASRIQVDFHYSDHTALLTVQDDGVGFEIPESWIEMVRNGHYGLAGIAERVESFNGKMEATSNPGKGTSVRVSLPLNWGGGQIEETRQLH